MSEQGRYRKLYARLWRNPDFGALALEEKMLSLYLLSGPQTNRVGLFLLSSFDAQKDLFGPADAAKAIGLGRGPYARPFEKRLFRVCAALNWKFSDADRLIYIPSWWRWNPPANINVLRGSLKDLIDLPASPLIVDFADNVDPLPRQFHEPFREWFRERFGERFRERFANTGSVSGSGSVTVTAGAVEKSVENSADDADEKPLRRTTPTRATDERLAAIAHDTIRDAPKSSDVDYLIDHFQNSCRSLGMPSDRATAIRMLTAIGAMR